MNSAKTRPVGEYIEVLSDKSTGYVKESSINDLKKVEAVIFDCDGVLIDARNSYNKTIGKTFSFILTQLMSTKVSHNILPANLIYSLRRTGGFNNDCDTTSAILLYTLTALPREASERFSNFVRQISSNDFNDLKRRFDAAKGVISTWNHGFESKFREDILPGLYKIIKKIDSSGLNSFRRVLLHELRGINREEILYSSEKFLSHPGPMKDNLVVTIFDEIFLGRELFTNMNGRELLFNDTNGLINKETVIVRRETLDHLDILVGREKMGIASGRSFSSALHTLKSLIEYFNHKALVFIEDEERKLDSMDDRTRIWKPQPFSLMKALESISDVEGIVYVGDSAEDRIMVDRVRTLRRGLSFTAVYGHTNSPRETMKSYLGDGVDIVLPTVNELPIVLEHIRGM